MAPSRSNHSTARKTSGASSHTAYTSTSASTSHTRCPPRRSKSDDIDVRKSLVRTHCNDSNIPPRLPRRSRSVHDNDLRTSARFPTQQGNCCPRMDLRQLDGRPQPPPPERITSHSSRQGLPRGNSVDRYNRPLSAHRNDQRPHLANNNKSAYNRGEPVDGDRSAHNRSRHSTIRHSRESRSDCDQNASSTRSRITPGHRKRPDIEDKQTGRRGRRIYKSLLKLHMDKIHWSNCCSYFVPMCVLIGASTGLLFATGSRGNPDETVGIADRMEIEQPVEDPYNGGKGPPKWFSNGSGLAVKIVQSLSSEWDRVFESVVEDFEYGTPDAITLSVEKGTPGECRITDGSISICNGNYGDTKWRGLSEFEVDGSNNVVAASIKMNDFYLASMSTNAWQFTLCHEFGHTLGLQHLDEDFRNADFGSCMEYTNNVAANKHPNQIDYEILLQMYGAA